ncbi:hypothetical protein LXL04_011955 [Taraxacum kok-saghyz]
MFARWRSCQRGRYYIIKPVVWSFSLHGRRLHQVSKLKLSAGDFTTSAPPLPLRHHRLSHFCTDDVP